LGITLRTMPMGFSSGMAVTKFFHLNHQLMAYMPYSFIVIKLTG